MNFNTILKIIIIIIDSFLEERKPKKSKYEAEVYDDDDDDEQGEKEITKGYALLKLKFNFITISSKSFNHVQQMFSDD